MQPQVPIRNYVYFLVSVVLMLVLWTNIRQRLFPPPPVPEKVWAFDKKPIGEQIEMFARLAQAPTGMGLGDAANLALQPFVGPFPPQPIKVEPKPVVKRPESDRPLEEVTLGGAHWPITAVMTNQGAGVRELVLNPFKAVDRWGLKATDANGNSLPVTLIPRHNDEPPAFAIFHYATADEAEKFPLDTLGELRWAAEKSSTPESGPHEVVYSAELPELGVRLVKAFTLSPHEYHLSFSLRIEKIGDEPAKKFRYQLIGASGLPIEGEWYTTTFRNAFIGLTDPKGTLYRITTDNATVSRQGGSERYRADGQKIIYAAVGVQFFASAMAVETTDADGKAVPADKTAKLQFVRATLEGAQDIKRPFLDDMTVRAIAEPVEPLAGQPVEHRYTLYHGPMKVRQLSRLTGDASVAPQLVDHYADTLRLKSLTDYGSFGWWTDLIVMFTNIILTLVGWLSSFLPTGIAILCVTIIVRGMMYPVSKRQASSMQRMQDKMAKLAPEMKEIDKKFKDDFVGKQQAQRELYRKHNVNPMASLGGCFMIILQMPIFMGLYYALQESVFFRLERFLWIRNLAAPDMLMWWGEKVPWLTNPDGQGGILYLGPYLNLLPLIGAVLIFIQQKSAMPKEMSDEQRQQYAMMKYMTGFMVLMFYKVPAGLSLYFIASSLWGLAERKLVKKSIAAEAEKMSRPSGPGAGKSPLKTKDKEPPKPQTRLRLWWEKLLRDASKK